MKLLSTEFIEPYAQFDIQTPNLNFTAHKNMTDFLILHNSLINFVELPNGSFVAKSKMSFESEQAQMANEFIKDNKTYQAFLKWCFNNNYSPIFELTSHKNQIVVQYNKTELRLLHVRDYEGRYFNAHQLKKICYEKYISITNQLVYNLDELMEMKEYDEGYEGYVVTFEDATMVKIKLNSYLLLHSVVTDLREDTIIELVLQEKLDDVKVLATGEKLEFINRVEEVAVRKINQLILDFKELRWRYFNEFKENRKAFAMEYKDRPMFGNVMRTINSSFRDVNEIAKNDVRLFISTRILCSLTKSKEWIEG